MVGIILLFVFGGFFLISSLALFGQMAKGNFELAKKIHQDMDPNVDNTRWWIKIIGVAIVGLLWIIGGILYLLNKETGTFWINVGLWFIIAEQIVTMLMCLKYWKAYTGVLVGVGLYFLISTLVF